MVICIKETLISLGYDFNKYTDEELILIAFIHYGSEIFKKFNGIFSFAIYNESKKELILVRDHLGIKPLYYTILDNTLIFSTESTPNPPKSCRLLISDGLCPKLTAVSSASTPIWIHNS